MRTVVVMVLTALTLNLAPAVFATAEHHGRGPTLTVPEKRLAKAVWCDRSVTKRSARQAVLLIHGTGATPEEAWGWSYQRALPESGYGICTVTLPDRAVDDFTVSAEYAVYAARVAYRRSGRKIAIIGHSQGGLMAVWIAKFWPDVARHATDVISLAGPIHGTRLANTLCAGARCSPLSWQMSAGSRTTTAAVNAALPAKTAFTSIGSRFDEVVFPQPYSSTLPGASTVMVQDICPGRAAEHGSLLSDAVGYELVLDALTHRGPAVASRVDPAACLETSAPYTDTVAAAPFVNTVAALFVGLLDARRWVNAEPPLPRYARRYGRG